MASAQRRRRMARSGMAKAAHETTVHESRITSHASDRAVAVLGAGYAGMAAAVTLTDAGVPVTVYEAAKELGGRARRVTVNDVVLDNGLHVLIGAYRETLRLVRRVHENPD